MKLNEAIKSDRFADERHRASVNMLYTTYWLKDHFINALKPHGISLEQHNVLRILNGSHPEMMRVKDIASRMVEKSSNVPRIVDKLVIKELVRRIDSVKDKRETFIELTDKGVQAINEARRSIDEITHQVLMLNDDEARTLNELLEKMRG